MDEVGAIVAARPRLREGVPEGPPGAAEDPRRRGPVGLRGLRVLVLFGARTSSLREGRR